MADIMIAIQGNASGVVAAANQATAALNNLESSAHKTGGAMSSILSGIGSGVGFAAGLAGINGIAGGLNALGDATVGFNARLEQSTIAFTSMLGSAEKAQAFLADMKQFAATTPFEFPDLLDASKRMLAFGFSAKEVRPLLTAVGSAAAAMGAGRSGVDAITRALGQMKAATVVQAGELNQLTEQGVPAFQILADKMGITTGEVKKLASEGKILSDVFIDAFQEWATANYGDMMAKQALTFEGAISTIKDSVTFAAAQAFKPFFELLSQGAVALSQFVQTDTFTAWADSVAAAITDVVRQLGDAVRTVQQVFADDWLPSDDVETFSKAVGQAATVVRDFSRWIVGLPEPVKAAGLAFAGVLAAVGPLSGVLGALRGALLLVGSGIGVLLGPIGLLAAAVAALAAAWTVNLGGIQEKSAAFVEIVGRYFDGFAVLVQQALTGNVGAAFENLKTMVGMMAGELQPLLAAWGQEFIDWITVAGPPMLAAAATLGADLLSWIGAQVQPIITKLGEWGAQFVAWVAPQIPPLLEALGGMLADMLTWLGTQVTAIAGSLFQWFTDTIAAINWAALATSTGALLGAMMGEAIVSLANSGPIISEWLTTITQTIASVDWNTIGATTGELMVTMTVGAIGLIVGAASVLATWTNAFTSTLKAITWADVTNTLGELLTAMVTATLSLASILNAFTTGFATAIVQGITGMNPGEAVTALGAWVQGVIDKALGAIKFSLPMPSFGGGSGMTSLSYSTGGRANPDASGQEIDDYIRQAGRARGMSDADIEKMVKTSQGERAGQGARAIGDGGKSFGPMQLYTGGGVGNEALAAGIDVRDPSTWKQQVDFALDAAIKGGFEQWTVARNLGFRGKASGTPRGVSVAVPDVGIGDIRISQAQWGASVGMTAEEAAAACGPYAAFLFAQATGRTPNPQEAEQLARASGWTPAGMGGTGNFMNLLGSMGVRAVRTQTSGMSPEEITQQAANAGPLTAFSTPGHYFASTGFDPSNGKFNVGATGTFAGGTTWMTVQEMAALMGPIQDIITLGGQMGATFTTSGKQVTDGIGVIPPATETVNTAVQTMGTGIDTMAANGITSVTNLGGAMMTTTTDAAGSVITTITDMQGQVTSQYATLANGAQLTMGDMNAGILTSTTDLGTGIMTTVQDMSGNYITTITDMAGNVTSQYTTLAGGVTTANAGIVTSSTDTSAQVVSQYDLMTAGALTSVTDLGTGTLTTVQDMAGNTVATITDMQGEVVSQSATLANGVSLNLDDMSVKSTRSVDEMAGTITTTMTSATGESVKTVTDMSGRVVAQYATMSGGVVKTVQGMATDVGSQFRDIAQTIAKPIKPPDLSGVITAFKNAGNAAKKAGEEFEDAFEKAEQFADKGGAKSGSKGLGKKAMGGWTIPNQMTLVGEEGPELISDSRSRYVYTAAETRGMMSGGDIDYDRLARTLAAVRPEAHLTQYIDAAPSASEIQRGTQRAFRRIATDWDFS
jgi:tape measure domain-containing protein